MAAAAAVGGVSTGRPSDGVALPDDASELLRRRPGGGGGPMAEGAEKPTTGTGEAVLKPTERVGPAVPSVRREVRLAAWVAMPALPLLDPALPCPPKPPGDGRSCPPKPPGEPPMCGAGPPCSEWAIRILWTALCRIASTCWRSSSENAPSCSCESDSSRTTLRTCFTCPSSTGLLPLLACWMTPTRARMHIRTSSGESVSGSIARQRQRSVACSVSTQPCGARAGKATRPGVLAACPGGWDWRRGRSFGSRPE